MGNTIEFNPARGDSQAYLDLLKMHINNAELDLDRALKKQSGEIIMQDLRRRLNQANEEYEEFQKAHPEVSDTQKTAKIE